MYNTPKPIISIVAYDNFDNEYSCFIWREDFNGSIKKINDMILYSYNSEEKMLQQFVEYIREKDADLLISWYRLNAFDWLYLVNRMKKINVNYSRMSIMNNVYVSTGRYRDVKIYGKVIFDLMKAYKKDFVMQELSSYKLDTVAMAEFGIGKIKNISSPGKLWNSDIKSLIEYCKRDVELMIKLDNKFNIIQFNDEKRRETGCLWEHCFSVSSLNNTFILRKAKKDKIRIPSRKYETLIATKGAQVFSPEAGLYDNIMVFDIKSLYPNAILSCNISPEMIDSFGEIRLGNGISFKSSPEGFIPAIIREQLKKREYYKELIKKEGGINGERYNELYCKQYFYKVLPNSWYGVFNSNKARNFLLRDTRITDSITWIGREIIKWSKDNVEKNGYKVIYGDTDSIFIIAKSNNVIEEGKILCEKINNSFGNFCKKYNIENNNFLIQFEKIYSRLLFTEAKKKYVGYLSYKDNIEVNNKMEFIGFEVKRSDSSIITKKIQTNIFRMLLNKNTLQEVDTYIKMERNKILKNEYNIYELGIPRTINKKLVDYGGVNKSGGKSGIPPQIIGAIYSNKYLNTDFSFMSKIKFIYVKRIDGYPFTETMSFDNETKIPKRIVINYKKMLPVILDNKIDRIYEALNWTKEKNIKSLNEYI